MKKLKVPNIKLTTLLSRKKLDLASWSRDNGIFTYSSLVERCNRIGVEPPSEETFIAVLPIAPVSSPTDGIVVLSAAPVIIESTGEILLSEEPVEVQPEPIISKRSKRSKRS